jgi:hypothetical protein
MDMADTPRGDEDRELASAPKGTGDAVPLGSQMLGVAIDGEYVDIDLYHKQEPAGDCLHDRGVAADKLVGADHAHRGVVLVGDGTRQSSAPSHQRDRIVCGACL